MVPKYLTGLVDFILMSGHWVVIGCWVWCDHGITHTHTVLTYFCCPVRLDLCPTSSLDWSSNYSNIYRKNIFSIRMNYAARECIRNLHLDSNPSAFVSSEAQRPKRLLMVPPNNALSWCSRRPLVYVSWCSRIIRRSVLIYIQFPLTVLALAGQWSLDYAFALYAKVIWNVMITVFHFTKLINVSSQMFYWDFL